MFGLNWAWLTLSTVTFAAALSVTGAARADDLTDWRTQREAKFAAFHAAHAHPDAEIRRIKAKTAALMTGADRAKDADTARLDRPPVLWRTGPAPMTVWDAAYAPPMIVVPAGEYTMGSPATEPNRKPNEGPRRRVRLGYAFAVSEYPITVGEFAFFVAATQYDAGDNCRTYENAAWKDRDGRSWRDPGFTQTAQSPVTCMDYDDAVAYAAWLSKATGRAYRLLSDAEYEYANRAGTTTAYWWGDSIDQTHVNCDGCGALPGRQQTMDVGGFPANGFGLYDTTGNVWSWTSDCSNPTYDGAPGDGSANTAGDCRRRISRGGAWYYVPGSLRSALRLGYPVDNRNYHNGFRLAATL